GREEAAFLDLEDDRDQDQAEDHPDRGKVTLHHASQLLARVDFFGFLLRVARLRRGRGRRGAHAFPPSKSSSTASALSSAISARAPALLPSPVIAATTCSSVTSVELKSPAERPRRRTTIRSQTSKTSARLWLITTTPRLRSRRRLISASTCLVCGTPRAAVGSSSITIFGSPSNDRATATCWRWPPESVPTSLRRLGIVTARFDSSSA